MSILSAVKSDDNKLVTVTVHAGMHQHGGCCYGPGFPCGSEFTVPYKEGKCFLEDETDEPVYNCPFPPYCSDGDINSKPLKAYRDSVVLAAGVAKEIMVPVDGFSCCPAYVHITSCGGCVWANYGADGSVDPAYVPSVDVFDGTAPDMNPTVRTLNLNGEQVDKISLVANADTIVQLEYFGA